jgi:hypothetical protein
MWHQAGARAMHRKLLAQGRTLGDEGRAKIAANRVIRAEQRRQAKIRALSSVTIGEKGPDGLTREQREANELLNKHLAETEAARVECLRQEWLAKQQKRLTSPVSERRTGITGSMSYPY